ncbi:MAG: hypothetical protein AAB420_01145 [Patescibacteria group bacterium]
MKFKFAIFGLLILYGLSYVWFRNSHQEISDGTPYVIFANKTVYYFYRPMVYLESMFTDMQFHIGPHAEN